MQKALTKVELTNILFISSDFVIQFFEQIQTLKPVAFLKTANQYNVSVSSTKDTNTACKQFTGRLLDKTHHGKTMCLCKSVFYTKQRKNAQTSRSFGSRIAAQF